MLRKEHAQDIRKSLEAVLYHLVHICFSFLSSARVVTFLKLSGDPE